MIDGVCDSFEMFFVIVVVPLVSTDYCLLWEFSSKGYFLFVFFYECSLQMWWKSKSFGLNPCFALYFVILETCSSGEVTCIIPEKVRQSYCFWV